ncbi:unnamed protein product [Sphagnum balticum]
MCVVNAAPIEGKLQAQLNSACLNWRSIAYGRMQKLVLQMTSRSTVHSYAMQPVQIDLDNSPLKANLHLRHIFSLRIRLGFRPHTKGGTLKSSEGGGASVRHQPPKASGQYTLQSANIPPIQQFDTGMKFA